MTRKLLFILLVIFISGCGRKGPLIPPDALAPAPVRNLIGQQTGDRIRLTWQAPEKELSGRPLRDLAGYRLYRRISATGSGQCQSCSDSWILLQEIVLGTLKDSPLFYDENIPTESLIEYRMLAFTRSEGISSPTPVFRLKTFKPLAAPEVSLETRPVAIRINLKYQPPVDFKYLGINIYRTPQVGANNWQPLNDVPVTTPAWDDLQVTIGSAYTYYGTAVLSRDGQILESLPSKPVSLSFSQQELP